MSDSLAAISAALADRYRIARLIATGGMAEVFAAHDIRHDRDVAIKVLKAEISPAIGSQRFLQEIRISAKLFHPHILTLLDSGEAAGLLYYVMPLVEGGSLRTRLERDGPLPIATALQIARECADALAFAHAQGVIHRDIKPENILFEATHATIADFGVARALTAGGNDRLTTAGIAVGTPAYMSPEQAAGEAELDARSDIYSLAIVLFEMLAGKPPFKGRTSGETMAKQVTEAAPPITAQRKDVPLRVARALAKALAKNPEDRFATASDFGNELEMDPPAPAAGNQTWRRVGVIAGALVLAALAFWVTLGRKAYASRASGGIATALNRQLAQVTFAKEVEQWPVWSSDGKRLLYVGETGGRRVLVIRTMDSGNEHSLTHDGYDYIQPSWSADVRHVAFVRGRTPGDHLEPGDVNGTFTEKGDIWQIDLPAHALKKIVDNAFNPAYSPDGKQLAFDAAWSGSRRIWISDAEGGNPRQVTSDSTEAVAHAEPTWSPDGKRLAFRRIEKTASDIVTVDLASQQSRWITHDNVLDMNPAWSPDGKSIYYSSAGGGGLNIWRVPVNADGERAGAPQQLTTGAGDDINPAPSPNGKQLAFSVRGFDSDIWRLPVDPSTGRSTGQPEVVTATTRVESRGSWSPDGSAIAFNSDRLGEMNIWIRNLVTNAERHITTDAGGDYQPDWSPDGRRIAFFSARAGGSDIWSVGVRGDSLRQLTTDRSSDTNPFFSPDGRQIAFMSDRRGRLEVWVMGEDGSGQHPIGETRAGGHFIRWSRDGSSVVFRAESGTQTEIVEVRLSDGATTHLPKVVSGAHMSWSPAHDRIMDVQGHKTITVYPLVGEPYKVFEFPDPNVRIDYPVWSPNGKWVLFDRAAPSGGDIWILR
ncbi:MAG: eukaryotic-like serine/threonine-protein kinase [Gemmatimonadaceae bacterium]|nr:eukaryotic-like serine/threonine-protein kinase [Gemmatimonadaceae bacterium]